MKKAIIITALVLGFINTVSANGINGCYLVAQRDAHGHVTWVQVCPR